MRHIWDTLGAVAITALVVYFLMQFIKPYTPYIIIAVVIVAAAWLARRAYYRRRYW